MNNYFQNKEHKNLRKSNMFKITSSIILLLLIGFGTYLITNRLTNPKYQEGNIEIETDETVYNGSNNFEDGITIVLKNDGNIYKTQTLKEFKNENKITSEINEQFVVNYFEANGYKLDEYKDTEIVFSKDSISTELIPNKYYIGEKDGYFAIYKTDSNGKPIIEESKDIYTNSKQVKNLPVDDQQEIKNFKHCFDTKEEAQERLSGYIS